MTLLHKARNSTIRGDKILYGHTLSCDRLRIVWMYQIESSSSAMPHQRRSVVPKATEGDSRTMIVDDVVVAPPAAAPKRVHEVIKSSLSLEAAEDDEDEDIDNEETVPLADSDDESGSYEIRKHNHRIKKWKDSAFAVGLTEPTWKEERTREPYTPSLPRDDTGCLCCSAHVCALLGAGRVGNMAVLKQSQEWVEEVEDDQETGQQTVRRYARPRLDIVVGPYWPMLCFVTYPIIFGVSGWTLWSGILGKQMPAVLVFVWTVMTLSLISALALTAFRDPGIMYRNRSQQDSTWRWSDQADSYRPRHAWFDSDTAVVVEGFDHT
jgi:hypothetical protein